MVEQHFARFRTNLGNLCISQDICYVQMTDNNFLNIYGHCASLLNNNGEYWSEVVAVWTRYTRSVQKRKRANIPQYGSS